MASSPGDSERGELSGLRGWRCAAAFPIWVTTGATAAVRRVATLHAWGWLLLATLGLAASGDVSAANAPTEDQVKAAFLLNFPKYVEWPPGTFADSASPIVLTIVADRGVEKEVRRMAQGKLFNGRALEVRTAEADDAIANDCQIVFISFAEERRARAILAGFAGRAVLTVGESEDFFADGGMINLVRHEQKVRLAVNLPVAEARELKISSKLLSVADVVKRREAAGL